MEIKELTPEQVREWSLEKKDAWWLKEVYRGDMPQLNLRSALTGMILGGVLSLTNLYIGIKTGWTLGVGVSSVILSFSMFKLLSKLKIGKEMTILENNAMQSVATSAGYMTAPLISAIPAYMMVTGNVILMEHTMIWIVLLSILGVLYAFPLKKRFINEEQLPFPEGYAAAIVLENLHEDQGKDGLFKAKLLMMGAGVSAFFEFIRDEAVMTWLKLKFFLIPEHFDDFIYKFVTPRIMGTPLKDLTLQLDTSIVMVGAGGIMGIKTGVSLLFGAFINYCILAPLLIKNGVIAKATFKEITMWSLWFGASMMTTASLYSFFSKPKVFVEAFGKLFKKRQPKKADILKDIELPLWVSFVFIPIVGALMIWLGNRWFHFGIFEGILAIPLVFVFTLIAVTSTGLTSITPGGALGKLTQLTYSIVSPGNIGTNIMAAGINSEVALNASNLLMDIKPGYMLGAKPRQQAVGHILGIFAGAAVSVPVYYLMFHGDISLFTSDKLPMPGALIWKAVAQALTKGLSVLHPTAQAAAVIGALLGIFLEWVNIRSKGKFPFSPVGLGLAFVLRGTDSLSMGLGSIIVWGCEKRFKKGTKSHKIWVENAETICAGVVAGGSIIGMILVLLEVLVIGK